MTVNVVSLARVFVAGTAVLAACSPDVRVDRESSVAALRAVADGVLMDASMLIVERTTGKRLTVSEVVSASDSLALASPYNDWRYWTGVLHHGLDAVGEALNDTAYSSFSARNVEFGFSASALFEQRYRGEDKWSYPYGQFFVMNELDDCGAIGSSVIEVHRRHPRSAYHQYLEKAARHILLQQSRLDDGTFVRSFPRRFTLWADDLYMGVSFLSRYGAMTGRKDVFDDATRQVIQYHRRVFDTGKKLMAHCWYADSGARNPAFWGRANGWAMLAQIDLLERLPEGYEARDTLVSLFRRHVEGIARYQSTTGLWHQLLDRNDTYLETSASAMFTYSIARAVQRGFLEEEWMTVARDGWNGVLTRIRPDGQIEGVCTGTVVSDDLAYYERQPTPLNDIHGIGAVLLAGAVILSSAPTN
jgi:rhamnogalacturonyl hydrolase YesR